MAKLTREDQFLKNLYVKKDEVPSFEEFPFSLPAVRLLDTLEFHPNITYIIGENGMGKSTLLEGLAVALGFNAEGGSLNFNFSSYASHSPLHDYLRVGKGVIRPQDSFFFRAETFYNVATNIEEMDREPMAGGKIIDSFGGVSLHEQSHGESFFAAFLHRFRGEGLYILDEPEAALSPLRQLSMLSRINELVEQGSQLVIATHSPLLMAHPDSCIYQLSSEGLKEQVLEETEHYTIMKQFFEDKGRLLHHLFK
ncbi:AAA family ATPase [Jeotgalibacillus campisalis]|uniref:AAA+ ATPase domain-containing protein n=1 Tax=Jeotgalibacillus campisalis TaxID=220754 RepID=A0A0C2SGH3_9BACL|nr:AAA family ATPase [Jeotgalibacillus campisalis]KIL53009.1 hypothetical protein KR50_03380 [Jeotgalibacillus campisalis]